MKVSASMMLIPLLVWGISQAGAATTMEEYTRFEPKEDNYGPNELRIDVAASVASLDREHYRETRAGFAFGANYFFSRYLGAGVDTYAEEFDAPRHVDFSFLARYPLPQVPSLAPYLITGFGRQFSDHDLWEMHFGGGVEYRFNRVLGMFTDIRGIFTDELPNIALWRVGFRFGF